MKGVENGSVHVGGGGGRGLQPCLCDLQRKSTLKNKICAVWGRDTVFQVLRVFRGACFFFNFIVLCKREGWAGETA